MSSTSASRNGDPALACVPRAAASVTSAANAPRASPDRAAAALTSSNSSSVSENCTTFGRDTACRDRRRLTVLATTITPIPAPSPSWSGPRPVPTSAAHWAALLPLFISGPRRSRDKQWIRISCSKWCLCAELHRMTIRHCPLLKHLPWPRESPCGTGPGTISCRRWPWPAGLTAFASDAMISHLMRAGGGSLRVSDDGHAPGAAGLHLAAGLRLLRPEEQVFAAMLDGLAQPAAGPQPGAGARSRPGSARCGRSPRTRARSRGSGRRSWSMSGSVTCARSAACARSTLRGYQEAVRLFCDLPDRPGLRLGRRVRAAGSAPTRSRWCTSGTPPCTSQDAEADPSKRAFTRDELQAFFDHADDAGRPDPRPPAARAGCRRSGTPPCSRSPTGTGCGATRPGCWMSPTSAATRTAPEFGEYGVCYVRHGKAMKGSPPKRRSVLTVWPWVAEVLDEWISRGPAAARRPDGNPALWPSERGAADRAAADQPPLRRLPRRRSGWTPGWTSTRCAAPTSRT